MAKLVTAKEIAARAGCESARAWTVKMAARLGLPIFFEKSGPAVTAREDFGRLIADCECGGAEYVDPDDLFFFCLSCGNTEYQGHVREVKHGV